MKRRVERVPAQPFADWLNQRLEHHRRNERMSSLLPGLSAAADTGAIRRLLQEIGWPDGEVGARRLYRYRRAISETQVGKSRKKGIRGVTVIRACREYPRDVVEDALHHAGVLFSDVYPEIAATEDTFLEPAAWCPGCQSETTPINGHCPWCEWRVGPETGQQLRGRRIAA